MATTTTKSFYRGAAATTSTTLYTAPNSSTTAVITSIMVTNTATTAATYTLSIDGVVAFSAVSIDANATIAADVRQVLPADATPKSVTGLASATTVNFHISGVEIV